MPAIKPEDSDRLKKEAKLAKAKLIPERVIEIFNEAIIDNLSGKYSTIYQEGILNKICLDMAVKRQKVFDNGWLDVEPLYEAAGWNVTYDKPCYNESYDPSWKFSKK
jgi:hypothetical protein